MDTKENGMDNYESDSDVLKIDEDRDNGKENKENSDGKDDDDIAEMDTKENGMDSEEEAMSNKELAERAVGFINPWTGEEIPGIAQDDDDSLTDGGLRGWDGEDGSSPPRDR